MPDIPENIYLALIVAVPAFLAPILSAWFAARNARIDRALDWARQDAVAERAAAASRAMLISQNAAIAAQEESTRVNAITFQETKAQLDALHTLGNSSKTAATRAELTSTQRELVALREIMEIKRAAGQEPSAEVMAVIEVAERRIAELEKELDDRKVTDDLATAQVEEGKTAGKIAAAVAVAAKPAAEAAARKVVPPVVTEVVPPVVKEAVKQALNEHDSTKRK